MNSRDHCREVETELTAYEQGELAESRRLEIEAHLTRCGSCSAALDEIRSVFTLAGGIEDLVPSTRFKKSLAAAIARATRERPVADSILFRIRSGAAFLVHRMRTSPRFRLAAISVGVHAVLLMVVSLVVLPSVADKGTAVVRIDPGSGSPLSDEPVRPDATDGPMDPGLSVPAAHVSPNETVVLRPPVTPELDSSLDMLPPDRRVPYRPMAGLFGSRLLDNTIRQRRLASLGVDAKGAMASIDAALAWLAGEQNEDGSWSSTERNPAYRTGVTGTALLAFFADGHSITNGREKWREVARRGVEYLLSVQQRKGRCRGLIGPVEGHYTYNHAMATMALVEAWSLDGRRLPFERSRKLRQAIGDAVSFIAKSQMPRGGWRYEMPDGTSEANNTSVAILQVMALAEARTAGFEAPPNTLDAFTAWLKSVTSDAGVVGYRQVGDRQNNPRTLTAGALFLEELFGLAAPLRDRQAKEVRRDLRDVEGSVAHDGLLRFYAVSAFRIRGENVLEDLAPGLLSSQTPDGFWRSADDLHAVHAGDRFLTALNVLTLTSAYRWQS